MHVVMWQTSTRNTDRERAHLVSTRRRIQILSLSRNGQLGPCCTSWHVRITTPSITDSLVLRILRGKIRYEYIRLKTSKDLRGAAIYGLLSNLFVEKNMAAANSTLTVWCFGID